MPAGAPTLYKPEYCGLLAEHLKSGLSFTSFAGVIFVNPDTLYEWCKVHKEFSETKKTYTAASMLFWEKMGRSGAAGQIVNFNSGAWIFNMKNRFRWADKQEITHDGAPTLELKYSLDE